MRWREENENLGEGYMLGAVQPNEESLESHVSRIWAREEYEDNVMYVS